MKEHLTHQIVLSQSNTQLKITTTIKSEIIMLLKSYFAKWSRQEHCWYLPLSRLSARAVHILAKDHKFNLHPEAATAIRAHFKDTPTIYREEDAELILQGLEDLTVHAFLRQRRNAQFLPAEDLWRIRPDYELTKFLLNNLPAKLVKNCRSFLESFTATSNPLERNSLDEQILHEPGTKVIPEGLTVAIGSSLHLIAQAVKVDYRLAIAFEGRPLPHTIGIVIRCEDFAEFQACAEKQRIQCTYYISAEF